MTHTQMTLNDLEALIIGHKNNPDIAWQLTNYRNLLKALLLAETCVDDKVNSQMESLIDATAKEHEIDIDQAAVGVGGALMLDVMLLALEREDTKEFLATAV